MSPNSQRRSQTNPPAVLQVPTQLKSITQVTLFLSCTIDPPSLLSHSHQHVNTLSFLHFRKLLLSLASLTSSCSFPVPLHSKTPQESLHLLTTAPPLLLDPLQSAFHSHHSPKTPSDKVTRDFQVINPMITSLINLTCHQPWIQMSTPWKHRLSLASRRHTLLVSP